MSNAVLIDILNKLEKERNKGCQSALSKKVRSGQYFMEIGGCCALEFAISLINEALKGAK